MRMAPNSATASDLKGLVRKHWDAEPCGTRVGTSASRAEYFRQIEEHRYEIEPHIKSFAAFQDGAGLRVLEIGVGAGTDHVNWLRSGAIAFGVDLTAQAALLTTERAQLEHLTPRISMADAESLPFANDSFDLVYSYGVLHHTPDTPQAVSEVHRVLKPGGTARVMIYHAPSMVGFMFWAMYGLGRLRPWISPRQAIYEHLESPGTKAYTCKEARALFSGFQSVVVCPKLGPGDLLTIQPSGKYRSPLARLAMALYPRSVIRLIGDRLGLGLFITAAK